MFIDYRLVSQTSKLSTITSPQMRCNNTPYSAPSVCAAQGLSKPHSLLDWTSTLAPALFLNFTRQKYYAYRPNALKRIRKHGLERRLSDETQREMLLRKIVKGKHRLTVFDRFLNEIPERRPKKKRISVFDPNLGYKKYIKTKERYQF